MAKIDSVIVADDEVVALAIAAGGAWLGPLPTVDESSRDDLLSAAARGMRSLRVRALTEGGEAFRAVAERLVGRGVNRLPFVYGYMADEADLQRLNGISFTAFNDGVDKDELLVVTTTDGVSQFVEMSAPALRRFVVGLVREVKEDRRGRALILIAPHDTRAGRRIVVTGARARVATYNAELDLAGGDVVEDVDSAVAKLLVEQSARQ